MKLSDLLSHNIIVSSLKSCSKEGIIEEMAEAISQAHPSLGKNEIASTLLEREKLGSTGIENGIAVPHAKFKELEHIILAIGRSREGVEFQSHDGKPAHLFFILLSPDSSAGIHLKTLAQLSKLLRKENVRTKLMEAETSEDIYNAIITEDDNLSC